MQCLYYTRWAIGLATKESGTRRTSSRPRKRPTCTQPKQPQPLWHLVEVLHGAEAHFPEVEEVVGEKEDLASKAFKNQPSFYHARKHCVPPQNYFFFRDFYKQTKKDDALTSHDMTTPRCRWLLTTPPQFHIRSNLLLCSPLILQPTPSMVSVYFFA